MDNFELFDTHCHPDFPHYTEDRNAVLNRMREAGVTRIVGVGVELDTLPGLRAFAEAHDHVWFSVGIHPNHKVTEEPTIDRLEELADHDKCVAIGETGMDFFHQEVEPDVQAERLRTHIQTAKRTDKPVIVHMRNADEPTLRIMKEEGIESCGGIMHCFSSTWEVAKAALDLNMSISFSGNVTFKRNDELRDVARKVPERSLLIETDSPYLAPVPMRGKRNEPAYVRHVAECIAEVRGSSLAHIANVTTENGRARFGV
ncbi:MAG TPA: TatD family hydrolase [Mariprofundaceae bacterium]|nr:TatD family hydrolase [Mariprofundaceae bacterium]